MKVLKKKILLTLSLPVDFFKKGESSIYQPYRFLYFLLPNFRRGSIRDAVGQLNRSGELDKIVRNNVPYFRLTGAGRERLFSFFPISLGQSRVWDRRWRIVIGTPRKVRRKLRELGFRKLARGVYITPMPVSGQLRSFLLQENLLGEVTVIESRRFLAGDDKNLAKKIWELEELVKEYGDFIKKCKSLLKKMKSEKRLKNRDKNEVVELFNSYFFLLSSDPGLPKKVLPSDWPADLARETFLSIFERLRDEELLDTI